MELELYQKRGQVHDRYAGEETGYICPGDYRDALVVRIPGQAHFSSSGTRYRYHTRTDARYGTFSGFYCNFQHRYAYYI